MARKIYVKPHYNLDEFHSLIKKTRNMKYRIKMLVIEKIMSNPNITSKELCCIFFLNTNTIFSWLKLYNQGGIEKLKYANGGNAKNRLGKGSYESKIYNDLSKEIDCNQDKVWTLEKMRNFIKTKYKLKKYPSLSTIHYQMSKTHSYKSSRPYPYKANRDEQGKFKKK